MKEKNKTIYRVICLGFCIHTALELSDKQINFITRCKKLKYQFKAIELLRRYLNKEVWDSSGYLESIYQNLGLKENVIVIEL